MSRNGEKPRGDLYARITDRIIAELERGVRPWVQPWTAENMAGRITRPLRHNGQPYTGIGVTPHLDVADALIEGLNAARSVVADLAGIGIDLGEVGARLQEQGVRLFTESHQTMAQTVKERHAELAAQLAARKLR